jgi:hypothetical protein
MAFANEDGKEYSTLAEYDGKTTTNKKAPLAYYRAQYRHIASDYHRPSLAAYYDEDFE